MKLYHKDFRVKVFPTRITNDAHICLGANIDQRERGTVICSYMLPEPKAHATAQLTNAA